MTSRTPKPPSSTPMSDDIEIREPAAKHTSPSEGLKRFTASESDEQREQVKQLMQDMHCTTHMPDCADWCDGDDVFLSGLMRIVAQHTKDAVERECLKARIDEWETLANSGLDPVVKETVMHMYGRQRVAGLSAPQQSTSPDEEQKETA